MGKPDIHAIGSLCRQVQENLSKPRQVGAMGNYDIQAIGSLVRQVDQEMMIGMVMALVMVIMMATVMVIVMVVMITMLAKEKMSTFFKSLKRRTSACP